MNTSTSVVAIKTAMFNEVCPNSYLNAPFKCPNLDIQAALAYANCLGVKNFVFKYVEDNETMLMANHDWDIFPFPSVIKPVSYNNVSFVSTSIGFARHSYFVSSNNLYTETPAINWLFVMRPFRYQTWALFTAFILFMHLVEWKFTSDNAKNAYKNVNFNKPWLQFARYFALTFICTVGVMRVTYNIKLDAMATVSGPKPPFKSTEDLARMVASGYRRLIRGGFLTDYIWNVISGDVHVQGQYPEPLRNLYNSTQNNPPVKLYDITEICEMLHYNANLVYVTWDYEILDNCPHYCFWSLDVEEVGTEVGGFLFTRNVTLKYEADVCVEYYRTYRFSMIKRKTKNFKNLCRPFKHHYKLINSWMLWPIFFVLITGLWTGFTGFATELIVTRLFREQK